MKKSIILGIFAAVGLTAGMATAGTLDDVKAKGSHTATSKPPCNNVARPMHAQ